MLFLFISCRNNSSNFNQFSHSEKVNKSFQIVLIDSIIEAEKSIPYFKGIDSLNLFNDKIKTVFFDSISCNLNFNPGKNYNI